MVVKSLEIINKSYHFWDDTIKIENFDPKLLKLDKKESPINIDIYYVGYVTKKAIYSINSVNPLYLIVKSIDGYVEEIDGSDDRYLVIDAADSNIDVINKFTEIWKDIKDKVFKTSGKAFDGIEFGKIRFNSDIALPLNVSIKFHALTVIIRKMANIFQKFTYMMLFLKIIRLNLTQFNYKC